MNKHTHTFLISLLFAVALPILGTAKGEPTRALPRPEASADDHYAIAFTYRAADAGKVSLMWKPLTAPLEAGLHWADSSRISDDLIYSPMLKDGEEFSLTLSVPDGQRIYYCFWVEENARGEIRDLWDTTAGGTHTSTGATTIERQLSPKRHLPYDPSRTVDHGWWALLLTLPLYLLLRRARHLGSEPVALEAEDLILGIGIALAALHVFSRIEIAGLTYGSLVGRGWAVRTLLAASLQDLFILGILTAVFLVLARSIRGTGRSMVAAYSYALLAALLCLFSLINVMAVEELGSPFTYQWLYYADFLQGDVAWSTIEEMLSIAGGLKSIAMVMATLTGGGILAELLTRLRHRLPHPVMLALPTLAILSMLGLGFAVNTRVAPSIAANPVVAFSKSALYQEASLFGTAPDHLASGFAQERRSVPAPIRAGRDSAAIENVVLIVLESVGAAYLDGFGGKYEVTPNLDRYASQALTIDGMYAHIPSSNRSMISLFSGIHPMLSYRPLTMVAPDLSVPSLPSELRRAGYRTSFFSSADWDWQNVKGYLGYQGFEDLEDYQDLACDRQFRIDKNVYPEGGGIDDLCIADRFEGWVSESSDPFLSVLWTVQGHYPYYLSGNIQQFDASSIYLNRYLNAIQRNDELVGRVMASLEKRGLAPSTLVVVVGDHGEAFGQHGHIGHSNTLYEEEIKVPCYFINGSRFSGERWTDLAGLEDIPTTVMELLGKSIPPDWQGRNLLTTRSNELFTFSPYTQYYFGYRRKDRKFLFNESDGSVKVYDLAVDPRENKDISEITPAEEIQRARARIGSWVAYQRRFLEPHLNRPGHVN